MSVPDHPIHESTRKRGEHPPCWNARKPFEAGFYAPDRLYLGGRWIASTRWVSNDWIEGGACQQPGPGYKPSQGCVGCKDLKP